MCCGCLDCLFCSHCGQSSVFCSHVNIYCLLAFECSIVMHRSAGDSIDFNMMRPWPEVIPISGKSSILHVPIVARYSTQSNSVNSTYLSNVSICIWYTFSTTSIRIGYNLPTIYVLCRHYYLLFRSMPSPLFLYVQCR